MCVVGDWQYRYASTRLRAHVLLTNSDLTQLRIDTASTSGAQHATAESANDYISPVATYSQISPVADGGGSVTNHSPETRPQANIRYEPTGLLTTV
jgi:hypothetical protein